MKTNVVIVGAGIIFVAIIITVPMFFGGHGHTRHDKAKFDISLISESLEQFKSVHGIYPSNEKGLEILVDVSSAGQSYKLDRLPIDPWGSQYHYQLPGQNNTENFDLWSYGADGQAGGSKGNEDIKNWR